MKLPHPRTMWLETSVSASGHSCFTKDIAGDQVKSELGPEGNHTDTPSETTLSPGHLTESPLPDLMFLPKAGLSMLLCLVCGIRWNGAQTCYLTPMRESILHLSRITHMSQWLIPAPLQIPFLCPWWQKHRGGKKKICPYHLLFSF